jgi:hypothetical protein
VTLGVPLASSLRKRTPDRANVRLDLGAVSSVTLPGRATRKNDVLDRATRATATFSRSEQNNDALDAGPPPRATFPRRLHPRVETARISTHKSTRAPMCPPRAGRTITP